MAEQPNDGPDSLRQQRDALLRERDELRDRLEQIRQVVGGRDPAKVVHDVRNIMNELVLLRELVELDK